MCQLGEASKRDYRFKIEFLREENVLEFSVRTSRERKLRESLEGTEVLRIFYKSFGKMMSFSANL